MNPPPGPLTLDLLDGAVLSALSEPRDNQIPFTAILLNEEGWRTPLEVLQGGRFLRGIKIVLVTDHDLGLILTKAFKSFFGYDRYSCYLVGDDHYDPSTILEIDLGYEKTAEIEKILHYPGDIIVTPDTYDTHFWRCARIVNNAASRKLSNLVAPSGYTGQWSLRKGYTINKHDGDFHIEHYNASSTDCICKMLYRDYGITSDPSKLLQQAIKNLKRVKAQFKRYRELSALSAIP